jgi:fibro-slime domain-containing protein
MRNHRSHGRLTPAFFHPCAVGLLALFGLGMPAHAETILQGSYYSVPKSALAPDFEKGIDSKIITGHVQSQLGPSGLPVVSTEGATFAGLSGPITMVNSNNEILWWTPSAATGITLVKQQSDPLPLQFNNLFVNGSNDTNAFLTARWDGSFSLPNGGKITIKAGADDNVWVFVDGKLQIDNGGVHAFAFSPTQALNLDPGIHTLNIFFADRHTVDSRFEFSAQIDSFQTPEPATMTLLTIGIAGIGGYAWRRRSPA